MKAQRIVVTAGLSAAGLAAVLMTGWTQKADLIIDREFDTVVSGSIPPIHAIPPAPPAQFSISNLGQRTVCLAERGATLTSRSRSFWAPPDCDTVWPGLATASSWIQNEDGSVTLSNASGQVILTLVRGKGFSYEAVDTPNADITWLMLP